jgi:ornithine cyclodeaminase/alanine dehydrogenase-like protein (mu-crystallin family)
VLRGKWLSPGTHVNAVGANSIPRRELDDEVALRSGTIVVESLEQAKLEAADLLGPIDTGGLTWDSITELPAVVTDRSPGRQNGEEITLFKSLGISLWDVAAGYRVYEMAKAAGVGREMPFD